MNYIYEKANVSLSQLTSEIKNDPLIATELSYMNHIEPDNLEIFFDGSLTSEEKTQLDTIVSGHIISTTGNKNYLVKDFLQNGRISLETWYDTDNGDGTYSGKIEETIYTYIGNKLTEYVIKIFLLNGVLLSEQKYEYYSQGTSKVIIKKI